MGSSGWLGQAPFDEEREPDGSIRPLYENTIASLQAAERDGLAVAVAQHLAAAGVSFGTGAFVVDPVPRLLSADEWARIESGLIQRTRALNAFLNDAYGPRHIVAEGVVAPEVIDQAEGYEPDLVGRVPEGAPPAAIIGFDLVRAPDGEFMVLEDNLRTPSGLAYLLAARAAVLSCAPDGLPRPRPVVDVTLDLLAATLHAAAPPSAGPDPVMIVLTDGPDNVAHYEHRTLAEGIGVPLLTPDDLRLEDRRLIATMPGGGSERVDVVYRRTDEDRVRDDAGAVTNVAELLVPPWLDGTMGLVNAFGNGVGDDKLVQGHVEDFIRFYLDEEPLVRSVPTLSLESDAARAQVIASLRDLVVKPRHGHGGTGVMIGSVATDDELVRAAADIEAQPDQYIAQPVVPLSRHPTVIDGVLAPRHVDLRPFAFYGDEVGLPPGGLSRVAFDEGEMVVNSSRNGGGKDTWVVE